MTRPLIAAIALLGVWTLAAPVKAAAQGCPANSQPVRQTEAGGVIRVTCRCNTGFAKVDTACRPVHEARAQLARRHQDALRGMESSMASLRDELSGQAYAALKDKIAGALTAIAAALVAKEVTLARTGAAALVAIGYVAYEGGAQLQDCTFADEDARTACLNFNNFRRIAESSLKQFEATFP